MQNSSDRVKPPYSLESVDNALRLVQTLRDEGRLRLKDAAELLSVAPSTAHRLLSMLVYRGFAERDESRTYLPGPAIRVPPAAAEWTKEFKNRARPHLEVLLGQIDETINLMIRVGTSVRFLLTLESSNFLRVGDRQGTVLPARLASGGKAMLAELPPAQLSRLYQSSSSYTADPMTQETFDALSRELRSVKSRGYALNIGETEAGLAAIGLVLLGSDGKVIGSFSMAAPAVRLQKLTEERTVRMLLATRTAIERDIADLR